MCKGYDPRAIKIGKLVKIAAASIQDRTARGAFIRSYVKIAEDNQRSAGRTRKDK